MGSFLTLFKAVSAFRSTTLNGKLEITRSAELPLNETYLTSNSQVRYVIKSGICTVRCVLQFKTDVNNATLVTGLPPATLIDTIIFTPSNIGTICRFSQDYATGNLICAYALSGDIVYMTFSYPIN